MSAFGFATQIRIVASSHRQSTHANAGSNGINALVLGMDGDLCSDAGITSRGLDLQQAFLDFVLQHYVTEGVEELGQNKLNPLLRLKYHDSIADAVADLGGKPDEIGRVFAGFQQYLYAENAR